MSEPKSYSFRTTVGGFSGFQESMKEVSETGSRRFNAFQWGGSFRWLQAVVERFVGGQVSSRGVTEAFHGV